MLTRLLIATVLVVVAISTSCESKYQAKNSNYECTYKLVYISNESCNNPLAENCAVKAIGSTNIIMYNSAAECAAFCCDPSFYNMFCSYTQSSYMVVVIIALSCFLFLLVAAICCYRLKD